MSAAFTPGPWVLTGGVQLVGNPDSEYGQHNLYVGEVRHPDCIGSICSVQSDDHCPPDGITRDVAEANASLIAAAPDLLAAVQAALQALHAIADEMTVGERYTNAGQYLLDALEPCRAAVFKATGAAEREA